MAKPKRSQSNGKEEPKPAPEIPPGTPGTLTAGKVRAAIEGSYGIKLIIAQRCRVSRVALWKFLKKPENAHLEQEIQDERETLIDAAESKLVVAIKDDQPWAIKQVLDTLGRKRGYVKRAEIADVTDYVGALMDEPPDAADTGTEKEHPPVEK